MLSDTMDSLTRYPNSSIAELRDDGSYTLLSFAKLQGRVRALLDYLTSIGVGPGHVLAIQAPTSLSYVVWDLAALRLGAVVLAIPDEMPPGEVSRLSEVHSAALTITANPELTQLPHFVALDDTLARRPEGGLRTNHRVEQPDLHSMVFSSGTTGKLKGLNISKSGTDFVIDAFSKTYALSASDLHLIFLPFSNYQQRMSVYGCINVGASIVLASQKRVFEAMRTHKPTFVIAPPVFFDTALELTKHSKAPLPALFGGSTRFLITGMAPSRKTTMDAYWAAGLPLYDAYGLTETGMVAWNGPHAHRSGSLGKPLRREDIQLRADGEVVIRRDTPLSSGYFLADDEDAAQTFTAEGIVTGDVASFDDEGYLYLVGRKKDVIVLRSGRKFHPTEVEDALRRAASISDVLVAVHPTTDRVTAIVPSSAVVDDDRAAVSQRIMKANAELDAYKRVTDVVFTGLEIFRDAKFRTRNLKLNRKSVADAVFAG